MSYRNTQMQNRATRADVPETPYAGLGARMDTASTVASSVEHTDDGATSTKVSDGDKSMATIATAQSAPPEEPTAALPLRILTCQTDGAIGVSVDENIARWRSTLAGTKLSSSDAIDVIHFPEMAFCRYYYRDCADLEGWGAVEEAGKGAVFLFGREMALHFNAYVIVGYAEKVVTTAAVYYNSLYVIGRSGNLAMNHRKRDLFQPDYTWAVPAMPTPPTGESEAAVSPGPSDPERPLPYSTLEMCNTDGQSFTAGLILCQEILGPMEGDHTLCRVARQFATESVSVVFFSNIFPRGNGKNKWLDVWGEHMQPMVEVGREWIFSVASACGEEENCLTKDQWGEFAGEFGDEHRLRKRGCSGVKAIGRGEAVGENRDGILDVDAEGWRLFSVVIGAYEGA